MSKDLIVVAMINIFLFMILAIYVSYRLFNIKELSIKSNIKSTLIAVEFKEETFKLLDKVIEMNFNDYLQIHPEKFDTSGEGYMNEDQYSNILKEITQRVYKNLTPALKAQIGLVYKFDTKEDQLTLILEKVGVILAIYKADMNTRMNDDTANFNTTKLF